MSRPICIMVSTDTEPGCRVSTGKKCNPMECLGSHGRPGGAPELDGGCCQSCEPEDHCGCCALFDVESAVARARLDKALGGAE
jgi:hypothetical protein